MLELLKFSFTRKYRKEFLDFTLKENMMKATSILWFMIPVEVVLIFFLGNTNVNVIPNIVFTVANTILYAFVYLFNKRKIYDKRSQFVLILFLSSFIFFGISVCFKNMNLGITTEHAYIIIVFALSSFICFTPLTNIAILLPLYGILWYMARLNIHDISVFRIFTINMFILNLFSILLNLIIFKLKYDNFLDKQDLMGKNEMLSILTSLDPMTKLYNHDCIKLHLKESINLSKSNGYQLTIAMLDIDDFKKVNDTHGHLVGDEVLQMFSTVLKESVRSYDIVGRYGGEEFIIIFKRTGAEEVQEIINRIRKRLQKVVPIHNVRVQFSCGISEHTNESVDELIESADKKLYYVKKHGKNSQISVLPDDYDDVICN